MPTSQQLVHEKVRAIVRKHLEVQGDFDDHVDLREYGLDSIKCIHIVVDLELEFGVVVPDEELVMENMSSVKRMVSNILIGL